MKRFIPEGRLRAPVVPSDYLERVAVLERAARPEMVCTLIIAPGGYGKTVLLTHWALEHQAFWYTCSPEDADPLHFAFGLASAISQTNPVKGPALLHEIESLPATVPITYLADLLISTIAKTCRHWAYAIDEHQVIPENAPAHALLDRLLHVGIEAGGRWAIASRHPLRLPEIARLRAENRLLEVDTQSLLFDSADIVDFALNLFGLELTSEETFRIGMLTEGWAALVSLTVRRLAQLSAGERTGAIGNMRGDRQILYDYFTSQILMDQPEPVRQLMLETSVLDTLRPELCEAITGREMETFFQILDEMQLASRLQTKESVSYAYHPLMKDFLRARLKEEMGVEAFQALCDRAARQCAQHHAWDEAFTLWERGGMYSQIARQLADWERESVEWLSLYGTWLERLPMPILEQEPVLLFKMAHNKQMEHQAAEAERLMVLAEAIVERNGSELDKLEARIMRAKLLIFQVRREDSRRLHQELEPFLNDLPPRLQFHLLNGLILMYSDFPVDLPRAARYVEQLETLARQERVMRWLAVALINKSTRVDRHLGNYLTAMEAAHHILNLEGGHPPAEYKLYAYQALGMLTFELGLPEAAEYLKKCFQEADRLNYTLIGSTARGYLAAHHAERGELQEAEHWLEDLERQGIPEFRIPPGARLARAHLAFARNDFASAVHLCEMMLQTVSDPPCIEVLLQVEYARMLALTGNAKKASVAATDALRWAEQYQMDYQKARALLILNAIDPDPIRLQECLKLCTEKGYESMWLHRERALALPILTHAVAMGTEPASAYELLEKMGEKPVRVQMFGGLRVWLGNREISDTDWARPRARAMFCYLLLQDGKPIPIETLLEEFWHDQEPEAARNSLRVATTQVRHALEPDEKRKGVSRYLVIEDETYRLELGAGAWQDRQVFEWLARRILDGNGTQDERIQSSERALQIASDPLLPEYRYWDWAVVEDEHLRSLRRDLRLRLIQDYLECNQPESALKVARDAYQEDSLDEPVIRLLLQTLVATDRHQEARCLYQRLQNDLQQHFQIAPDKRTQTLAQQLGL
jgi:ATP/maltotriose-dependent transcriptional regulator MalT/two-component SAPR family response regulator